MTEYIFTTKESRRTLYNKRKEERTAKAKDKDLFLQNVDGGFEPPPLSIRVADENVERSLDVPDGCAGLIIGKKGENLKSLEEKFKVKISLSDAKKAVPGEPQTVTIKGNCQTDVNDATNAIDYVIECVEVSPDMSRWLVGKGGCHIELVRELSGVVSANVRREGGQQPARLPRYQPIKPAEIAAAEEEDPGDQADEAQGEVADSEQQVWVELRGLRDTVGDAKLCVDAHLSYYPVFAEMEAVEADLDRQIGRLQAQLGRRAGGGSATRTTSASRRQIGTAPSGAERALSAPRRPQADGKGKSKGDPTRPQGENKGRGRGSEAKGRGRGGAIGAAPAQTAAAKEPPAVALPVDAEAVSNLMKKIPGLGEAAVRDALRKADGNEGRAAKILRLQIQMHGPA